MARGRADATAMEMTKWFDTNYHYLVPELGPEVEFRLAATPKPLVELAEARELGIATRPVLLGPVTFLLLGKAGRRRAGSGFDRLSLLDPLLEVYAELLDELEAAGAEWVQLDEPAFVQDRSPAELDALARAYDRLGGASARPRLLVSSYFDHLGDALGVLAGTPVDGIGLDLTRDGARNLELLASAGGVGDRTLVAGVVDGRNVWVERPGAVAVHPGHPARPGRRRGRVDLLLAPARPDRPGRRAGPRPRGPALAGLRPPEGRRGGHPGPRAGRGHRRHRRGAGGQPPRRWPPAAGRAGPATRPCAGGWSAVGEPDLHRASPYEVREKAQRARLGLPPLPTTTIGSFPQTGEVRKARAARRRGELDEAGYTERMRGRDRRGHPASRTSWSWTCSSTGSPSATTWSSTSASSWPGWPSPSSAGSSPTAPAMSARRSSSATCPGRPR